MKPRQAGALWLVLLTACATGVPPGRVLTSTRSHPTPSAPTPEKAEAAESDFTGADEYSVHIIEPGLATRPVHLNREEFRRAAQRLGVGVRLRGTPQEAARELMKARAELEGEWLAEVSQGQVLTLVPLDGRGMLTPEADAALKRQYLGWCEHRGGGDCLGLFDDGPYLRADDRRTLALALAFGSVLDETREALGRETSPRAVLASLMWAAGMYLGLWLLPEPATKGAAAVLTVLLVGWLGLDTFSGLVDGWAQLATRAHEATTFAELREAGEQYARVLGTDAARALILAVTALTGRTVGEVAAHVRTLPRFNLVEAQWKAQGGTAVMESAEVVETPAAREESLAAVMETVQEVTATAEGGLSVVMLRKRGGGSGNPHGVTTAIRHRGGNQQVVLANGQRWHLPRGVSPQDIPVNDPVGDQLQEAVTRAAQEWGPHRLSREERRAIQEALDEGKYWLARLLEREARGRFVENEVSRQLKNLYNFSRNKGVDVVDPATGRQYEILSGTESNLARHGRRMAGEFFRMLTF